MAKKEAKYGARVFMMDDNTILVCQTIKRGAEQNAPYVIDKDSTERFTSLSDDKEIADAVRAALAGRIR